MEADVRSLQKNILERLSESQCCENADVSFSISTSLNFFQQFLMMLIYRRHFKAHLEDLVLQVRL